jgi:1,4-alpha-glucan branching enzyme
MLYLDYSRKDGEWLPNIHGGRENLEAISFLQEVTATAYKRNPGIMMIAEESTSYPGVTAPTDAPGLGFGFKWNMGWMHDTLQYIERDPMYRSHHHGELTFSMVYAYSEHFMLPISHDEVVHGKGSLLGKMPGDTWQRFANLRAYLAYMWGHPGKQLLFMGQEFAQPSEWSEGRSLDWWALDQPAHRGIFALVARLNQLYRENAALWARDSDPGGFEWLDQDGSRNVVAFVRWDNAGNPVVVAQNFSGNPVGDYRLALPFGGEWSEVLNTDAAEYGGSGVGNLGTIASSGIEHAGKPDSAVITIPPLGAVWFVPRR